MGISNKIIHRYKLMISLEEKGNSQGRWERKDLIAQKNVFQHRE